MFGMLIPRYLASPPSAIQRGNASLLGDLCWGHGDGLLGIDRPKVPVSADRPSTTLRFGASTQNGLADPRRSMSLLQFGQPNLVPIPPDTDISVVEPNCTREPGHTPGRPLVGRRGGDPKVSGNLADAKPTCFRCWFVTVGGAWYCPTRDGHRCSSVSMPSDHSAEKRTVAVWSSAISAKALPRLGPCSRRTERPASPPIRPGGGSVPWSGGV
jgi:hypothetical protein